MLKHDLELAVLDLHKKLENGLQVAVDVNVKDHRPGDALLYGLITGIAFMISTIAISEVKKAYDKHRNKKWFEKVKKES